ncbi:hypothetical protein CPC08DRAFT_760001 [Agrocybe pediades]|nr:hypothetical protein CPC08DRAFT_760001 [Agrocybe pediades]
MPFMENLKRLAGNVFAESDRRSVSRPPTPVVVSVLEDYFNGIDAEDEENYFERYSLPIVAASRTPRLPEDVERIVFEMAAREDVGVAIETLVFVCHRVRIWVEYVMYETVVLKSGAHAGFFLKALERKHPEFPERAVRILALPPLTTGEVAQKILLLCKNLKHLSWPAAERLSPDVIETISKLPLKSLRLRLEKLFRVEPDFSSPIFQHIDTLFIVDKAKEWKEWKWVGFRTRPNIKWIGINLDGRLHRYSGWRLVRTLEKNLIRAYAGPNGLRLCICYHFNEKITGGRWIHRSEETFSEERLAILSLDHDVSNDDQHWVRRVNGDSRDFEISEELIRERFDKDRRMRFDCECFSFFGR